MVNTSFDVYSSLQALGTRQSLTLEMMKGTAKVEQEAVEVLVSQTQENVSASKTGAVADGRGENLDIEV